MTAAMLAAVFSAPTAHAGLFDDDEARRAILDIRAKIDAVNARVDGKADKTTSLSLSDQNDRLNQELAKLRGQIEVLTNELANTQQRQKDFYVDLDTRLRKLEPQKISVDGQEVNVGANDQKAYDAALATFKSGDYKTAATAFSNFVRSNPDSGLTPSAQYWLGNAYYALRDYKNAIAAQQVVVSKYADNPKAADALLNISSSYTELKNKPQSKRALEQLLSQYPNTPAAQTAKERLDAMK
ncbi:TPR repeat containing exported protein; Putative periplasmic protein contains a protein prenylyltransferase domain [Collimonas arenae]|uniref:Cell division coordinator CpoB n=1 Tax=Collimonas arenae TaxID=279058 RepID=A0A0A1FHE0_9BURK|nr:TPR repeat containing exported protein; Putative periplasmic protein contains a protein prenylyltransferase domain [Collimonas arenae]